jgi:hypoxia up-regulated 1
MHDLSTFGVSVKFDNLPSEPSSGGLLNWLMGNTKGSQDSAEASEEWSKHTPLFPGGSLIPSKTKTVAFHHDQNILCRLEYDIDPAWPLPAGASPLIGVFNITGIADFAKETASLGAGQPKVHLSFTLDGSGMVILSKAEATLELPLEPEQQPQTTDETKAAAESTEEKAAADSTESSPETEASETTEPTPPGPKEKGAEKKDDKKAKKPAKKEKKDNTLRRTLTVATNLDAVSPPIWSPELILEAKTRLKALDLADTSRKEKAAALNDLEAYVYKVRNRLRDEEDQLAVISTSEEREEAIELCNAVEDWLYDEGKNQELSAYKSKQSSIKSKAEAIFKVSIHCSPSLLLSHLTSPPSLLPSLPTPFSEIQRAHRPS